MREYKFRSYIDDDVNEPYMAYFSFEDISAGGAVVGAYDRYGEHIGAFDLHSDVISIMQYTGLKDKNGKNVYEGDIIRNSNFSFSKILPVIFSSFHAAFIGNIGDGVNQLLCRMEISNYEVIGNIHENPDLLDK